MIREHAFNTRWWGKPVGYVSNPAFFHVPDEERARLLEPYAWVETSLPLSDAAVHIYAMTKAGFAQVDTQVNFRINLKRVPNGPSLAGLDVEFADEYPFTIDSGTLAPFVKERFLHIPGSDQTKVDQRFELWADELIAKSSENCLQVSYKGQIQGWFLSKTGVGKSVNLALAMLARDANISGMYVYQKAFRAYTERGHGLGWASFSVTNTPVHNIYASLGAHFLAPAGNWLWLPDRNSCVESVQAASPEKRIGFKTNGR